MKFVLSLKTPYLSLSENMLLSFEVRVLVSGNLPISSLFNFFSNTEFNGNFPQTRRAYQQINFRFEQSFSRFAQCRIVVDEIKKSVRIKQESRNVG